MPRHPRLHTEGLLYHVMPGAMMGRRFFIAKSDYQAFIEALRTVRQRRDENNKSIRSTKANFAVSLMIAHASVLTPLAAQRLSLRCRAAQPTVRHGKNNRRRLFRESIEPFRARANGVGTRAAAAQRRQARGVL